VNAGKMVLRNSLVYWQGWRWSMFFSILTPVLFLSAMGLGVGSMIARDSAAFGGSGYLGFFATGILTASAMQSGIFSATYPLMSKIKWQRNYEAVLSTPLVVRDIVIGELAWIACLLTVQSTGFLVVMMAFGVDIRAEGLLAIPAAVLLGVACAAPVAAFTATLETDEPYIWIFRFLVMPLFLFSGTFFPITELPAGVRPVANISPVYHGIVLVRGFTIEHIPAGAAAWHAAVLVALLLFSVRWAIKTFTRRLAA
jgi:lipooligosaccharide transport system permease protein